MDRPFWNSSLFYLPIKEFFVYKGRSIIFRCGIEELYREKFGICQTLQSSNYRIRTPLAKMHKMYAKKYIEIDNLRVAFNTLLC